MSDGVLKSDPDAVWNYVVSLNENKEYVLSLIHISEPTRP